MIGITIKPPWLDRQKLVHENIVHRESKAVITAGPTPYILQKTLRTVSSDLETLYAYKTGPEWAKHEQNYMYTYK